MIRNKKIALIIKLIIVIMFLWLVTTNREIVQDVALKWISWFSQWFLSLFGL